MGAKKTKRAEKKASERDRARADSIFRARVAKAEYRLYKGFGKELRKGGAVHDLFFHFMLKDAAFAARFLNAYLPKKLRDALDLSDPKRIRTLSTDFYDSRVGKHVADLIFVVPCKEPNKFVSLTLIVEHKAQSGSSIDRKTVMQTLKYVALEVETALKRESRDAVLYQPLVVLFYTGANPAFEAPSWEDYFPLPEFLQVEELRETQIRFKPLCVNLTRLFLEDKLSDEDFLRVVPEIMARASLKRLKEAYSTLFQSLGQIKDWTKETYDCLVACSNYVALASDKFMTREERLELVQSVDDETTREKMKTIFELFEDDGRVEGRIEGKIEGKLETIRTIASLRFQDDSERLNRILTNLNDLKLLDQTRQFALTAPTLLDVENFAENLTQRKRKAKRVVKKSASRAAF